MRILNLAKMEQGNVPYEVISFSDSQKLINLLDRYANGVTNLESSAMVISRMSWGDLQLIIGAKQALQEAGFKHIHLFVPYFLGARSDRKFKPGGVNYLKDVICPIINAQDFESVTVMDPHSHCLEMGLKRFKSVSNAKLVNFAITDIINNGEDESKLVWLIPDKGAVDKAYETIKEIQFKGHVVECSKKREKLTGKIVETNIPQDVIFEGDTCIIVDDICDGGYTFLKLAEKAKQRGAGEIYLVTTHGIFAQGFEELSKCVNHIYTTDSVKVIDTGFDTLLEPNKDFVSQLKVLNW